MRDLTPAHYARLAAEALAMAAVFALIGALFILSPSSDAAPLASAQHARDVEAVAGLDSSE